MESRWRSVAKSLSWRVIAALITFCIALFITHDFSSALTISGIEVVGKTLLFYVHERLWARVPLGLTPPVPAPTIPEAKAS